MATRQDFVGAWKLISFHNKDEDGNLSYPFGKDAKGMIYYDRSGYMGVNIMPEGRVKFQSGDMFIATKDEIESAIKYISYAGKYTVKEDKVVHQIEVSLFPNWVGVDQERFYKFVGNRLVLSTRPMKFNGKKVVSELVWEMQQAL